MLSTTRWLALPVFLGLLSGCGHFYDAMDEHLAQMKCCHDAKVAWHEVRDLYSGVAYPYHFGSGFRAGYISVCLGGDGCPPALPPRKYWSVCYQCAEGKAKTIAWYDGWHHGALAAAWDECAGQSHLLTAFELYQCEIPPGAEHHIHLDGHDPLVPVPGEELGPEYRPGLPEFPPDPQMPPGIPDAPYHIPQGVPYEVNSPSDPAPGLPSPAFPAPGGQHFGQPVPAGGSATR